MKSLKSLCALFLLINCVSLSFGQVPESMYSDFSPDGGTILTADFDNLKFRLFDAKSRVFMHEIKVGLEKIKESAPDGTRVMIYFFNPSLARFSADGKSVYVIYNNSLVSWDIAQKKVIVKVSAVDYSDASYDRQWLVIRRGKSIKIYNTNSWKVWKSVKTSGYSRLSPDTKTLAVSDRIGEITDELKFFDVATGKMRKKVAVDDNIHYPRYSPDGKMFVYCTNTYAGENPSQLKFIDPASGKLLDSLAGDFNSYFSPDGKKMITMSVDDKYDYVESYASVWNVETRKLAFKLEGHSQNLNVVKFSPDGKKIGTSSDDGKTILWDAATGEQLISFTLPWSTEHMEMQNFDPTGKFLMTATDDGTFSVWDVTTGDWMYALVGEKATTEKR